MGGCGRNRFAVLFFFGFGAGNTPTYDASNQAWVSWFHDSGHRAAQIIGMFSTVAASLLLTVFFVVLLRRAVAAGGSRNAALIAACRRHRDGRRVRGLGRDPHRHLRRGSPSRPATSLFPRRTWLGRWTTCPSVSLSSRAASPAWSSSPPWPVPFGTPPWYPRWLVRAGYVVAVLLVGSFEFFPFVTLLLWVLVVGVVMLAGRPTSESRAATAEPGTMP